MYTKLLDTITHNQLPPTTLDFYQFERLIGKGAFGKVTLATHKLTGKQVAIKTIEKDAIKDEFSRKKVFQEIYILKKIRHENVIRLLEVFEGPKYILIVMEYVSAGDLLQKVKKEGRFPETRAKIIFKQIVYGLAHIHSRHVLHRDIKLDNILIDNDNGIKICDFGVSKIINRTQNIREECGTPAYIAPEVISEEV
jgi:serine/threonine protein kinase